MKLNFEVLSKALRVIYNSLLSFMTGQFLCYMFGENGLGVYKILAVFVIWILSYLIRDLIINVPLVLILHIIMGVVAYFLPGTRVASIYLAIVAMVLLSNSFDYIRFGYKLRPLQEVPWPTFLLAFFMYVLGVYSKNQQMINLVYWLPVLMFAIFLVMIYVEGLTKYVNSTKDVAGLPLSKIIQTNSIIIVCIMAIVLITIFLANLLNMDIAIKKFGDALLAIFKIIVTLIGLFLTFMGRFFGGKVEESHETRDDGVFENVNYSNTTASILELILKVGLIILAAYIVYIIFKKIIRFLILKRKHDNDVIEMLTADEREAFSEKKTIKKYIEEKLSSTEKARKIYRKKILRHKDFYRPDNFDTACDIKEEIEHQEKYDISELTARYEKIRYTDYKPDKKFLKEMEKCN